MSASGVKTSSSFSFAQFHPISNTQHKKYVEKLILTRRKYSWFTREKLGEKNSIKITQSNDQLL